jgi:kynureninase
MHNEASEPAHFLDNLSQTLNIPLWEEKFSEYLDNNDPLKSQRENFYIPQIQNFQKQPTSKQGDVIYLCGNSLGLQPKKAQQYLLEEMEVWRKLAVAGHFQGTRPWLTIDEVVQKSMANLVGAKPIEVCVMNTLTVNLHLMMVAFYRPTPQKYKIVIERGSFPSDYYAVESQIKFHGYDPAKSLIFLESDPHINDDNIKEIDDSVALVLLPGVQYFTGQFLNIPSVVAQARKHNCFVGLDLAHAVGNVPLRLHEWDVDFACWCSYKYLNSGPGGIGGLFVHEKHAYNFDIPRFAGWWGHDLSTRFKMTDPFKPIPGAFGFRLSNPVIFPILTLQASLECFDAAGMENLRKKSILLTGYLEKLIDIKLKHEVTILTPRNPERRGCQLSLQFHNPNIEAKEIEELLKDEGVICDVRGRILRVAPTPLYNTFQDVRRFVEILEQLLERLRITAENKQ